MSTGTWWSPTSRTSCRWRRLAAGSAKRCSAGSCAVWATRTWCRCTIDRATAGLVLFSADPGTRAAYQALFRERRIDKEYRALAPPLPGLALPHVHRSRLERGEPFFRMREVAGEPNSETRIEVESRGPDAWCYRLYPVTGRKHQLRVHMAALGAPILDDPVYPVLKEQGPDDFARPLQLLAHALEFNDPLDGTPRSFRSRTTLTAPDRRVR